MGGLCHKRWSKIDGLKTSKNGETPTTSKRTMQTFAHSGKTYNPKSLKLLQFEDDTIIICEEAHTPLSVVERTSFRLFVGNLYGHVTPISRTLLTWKMIPEKVREITVTVGVHLAKFGCICLSFDLWMTCKTEEIFPLQAHEMCACKYEYVHLIISYSKVGTDGVNISIPVFKLMEDTTIQDKVIAYSSGR